jgi:hypothetical protein
MPQFRSCVPAVWLAALGLFLTACTQEKPLPAPRFFVWMGEGQNHSDDVLRTQFHRLSEAGIHGIMYLCEPDRYPGVIRVAREFGLDIHAWQVILNCRDPRVMEQHPDWFTVSGDGKSSLEHPPFVDYYKWLCPTNPEVQDYVWRRLEPLVYIQGLQSIHLDYIRHSDVILPSGLWSKYDLVMDREYPQFDFCYCDACIDKFSAAAGRNPRELENPSLDPEWRRFRLDSVTRLVNRLAENAHARGMALTAAVFPTPELARKLVRQDWARWDLDAVYPMVYHSFYQEEVRWIGRAVTEGLSALEEGVPLICGIYLPSLNPDEMGEAIRLALDAGASGVCLFGIGGMSEDHWNVLAEATSLYSP